MGITFLEALNEANKLLFAYANKNQLLERALEETQLELTEMKLLCARTFKNLKKSIAQNDTLIELVEKHQKYIEEITNATKGR